MTYNELVEAIADDIGYRTVFTRPAIKRVLNSFRKVTKKALKSDRKVILQGFGAFYSVVPKKKALFGGTKQPRGKPVIRFREARHGKQ